MKPKLVQGTRDFSPAETLKRQYIFDKLREIFLLYGFQPIETPAMEMLTTLMGKYGDEGDQLLFKILNNGDFLSGMDQEAWAEHQATEDKKEKMQISGKSAISLAKRGLRYDLTVPFARYVVMNRNDIAFPFKRYQIQPVWRGDKPQKGRYREFYQCDVDVIGSESLLYEAELTQIYDQAFKELGIEVIIRLNNRKILDGIANYAGYPELFVDITVAIDKLDKIGWDGVTAELARKGLDPQAIEKVKKAVEAEDLAELKTLFGAENEVGNKGIAELEEVLNYLEDYNFQNQLKIDFTLARGLSYYTGCIFEVVVDTKAEGQEKVKMGSIGGGGRYDNLTGVFGWDGNSGVGISFGAARIYDVLLQLDRFDAVPEDTTQLIFLAFDEASQRYAFKQLQKVRAAGIRADIYPEPAKFKKQMKYVDKRGIKTTVIVGDKEMESGKLAVKDMETGDQEMITVEELIERMKK
jgi:histidyl-tRNA synthetase